MNPLRETGPLPETERDARAVTLATRIRHGWALLVHAGRMLVGMPDYDTYLAHLRAHHPGREPMSREQFFRSRQEARYGGGTGRCC